MSVMVRIAITVDGKAYADQCFALGGVVVTMPPGHELVFEDGSAGRGVLRGWEFSPTIDWIDDDPPPPPTPSTPRRRTSSTTTPPSGAAGPSRWA